jgi:predicted SAM-dependent methyltransferase
MARVMAVMESVVPRARELLIEQAGRHRWVRVATDTLSPPQRDVRATRRRLANRFLRGEGLEIGALHFPLRLPRGASVRYVDRMSREDLRREYTELATLDLVEVDVIDDGERLTTFSDASVDFIVANHFIEHTQDPIATLASHARVLRPGGVLFMAVPDKRATFDAERPVTTLEHLVRDHAEGPEWSRHGHFEEFTRLAEHTPEAEVAERARLLQEIDYSIHFHVFTPAVFAELLNHCRVVVGIGLELEALVPVRHEFIAVLRATDRSLA